MNTDGVYIAGLSTSLWQMCRKRWFTPFQVWKTLSFLQHGYAVEYDYGDHAGFGPGLNPEIDAGVVVAGQVNGTSGYEEAAIQGLIAGASAALGEPFQLGREQAYGGVLIDDLVTRGVGGEPYRMFSSRAEHRLRLREDNADRRLTPLGRSVGLVDDEQWARFEAKMESIERVQTWCDSSFLLPNDEGQRRLAALQLAPIKNKTSVSQLLRRPEMEWSHLDALGLSTPEASEEVIEQVVTDTRYSGYLKREDIRAENTRKMEAVKCPPKWTFPFRVSVMRWRSVCGRLAQRHSGPHLDFLA